MGLIRVGEGVNKKRGLNRAFMVSTSFRNSFFNWEHMVTRPHVARVEVVFTSTMTHRNLVPRVAFSYQAL